jgi:hypothetical protein
MAEHVSHGVRRSRLWSALVVVVIAAATAGCSTHRVATTNPCPVVTKHKVVVVAPTRRAIGMAKLGLTPKGLKAQYKCS